MPDITLLMVAEKPSIAQAVANALAGGRGFTKRKGISPTCPVFEFVGAFAGTPTRFKVTSTVGHVWSLGVRKRFSQRALLLSCSSGVYVF